MVSAQGISSATVDFFNDVSHCAFKLVEVLEASQRNKSHQLAEFNKMFKVSQPFAVACIIHIYVCVCARMCTYIYVLVEC